MNESLKELVRARADNRCEYCRLPQDALPRATFHIEHIVARQHEGGDDVANLALACDRCNLFKGPNLSTIDPQTGSIVLLFNPRTDRWSEHFRQAGFEIVGLTDIGRATVRLLNMNARRRVQLREALALHLDAD
jgi:HNH endonuclease